MREPEAWESEMPRTVWRIQGKEQQSMQVALTPDRLCALARSLERLRAHLRSASFVLIVAIATGFLYDLYRDDRPWIRLGVTWTLCMVVYLFGPAFENRARSADASEPCARFLEREHEERRRHYLRIRNRLFFGHSGRARVLVRSRAHDNQRLICLWFRSDVTISHYCDRSGSGMVRLRESSAQSSSRPRRHSPYCWLLDFRAD